LSARLTESDGNTEEDAMPWPPQTSTIAVLVIIAAASVSDLRRGRIPNTLTLGSAAVALLLQTVMSGWAGLAWALGGWVVGIVLFAPLYVVKGMGAGDVKLLAAIGSWLGPVGALWTALYGAMAGGVLALIVATLRGYTRKALSNVGTIVMTWRAAGVQPVPGLTLSDAESVRLPYALPLAVGAALTLWLH
jgi:prepilin peptidase CpaA